MSYATTQALLAIEADEALAAAVRARIGGKYGDPPTHDDWTWTEAVSRVTSMARAEPARGRLARAVKLLLGQLLDAPARGTGEAEWPAGLLRVVQQLPWTDEEREVVLRHLVGHLVEVAAWPIGRPTASALGSAAVELFRALRSVSPTNTQDVSLEAAIQRLRRGDPTEDADMELGALIGLRASYPDARMSALQPLRELRGERRDRVLYAIDREFAAWCGDVRGLARPLLDQFDEFSGRPSFTDSMWAGTAVKRLGEHDDPAVVLRVRQLCEPAPPGRKIKTPSFVRS